MEKRCNRPVDMHYFAQYYSTKQCSRTNHPIHGCLAMFSLDAQPIHSHPAYKEVAAEAIEREYPQIETQCVS